MHNLTTMSQEEFLQKLAGGAPTPGGGSVAALCGALGAALCGMVAGLTAGREKYADVAPAMAEAIAEAAELRQRLAAIVDDDSAAYEGVAAVFAMPKGTDEEKTRRRQAMQNALKASTETPARTLEGALSALRLCERILPRFNQNAASDLGVAALCLKTAAQGAWLNVLINLGGITDTDFTARQRASSADTLAACVAAADKIYADILAMVE